MKKFQIFGSVQKYCFILIAILILGAISSSNFASEQTDWTGNINVFLGTKFVEDFWIPVDEQAEVGFEFDIRKQSWPVNLAVDYMHAEDDYSLVFFGIESESSELNIGVRKIWDPFLHVRPFIGGGVSLINAEYRTFFVSDSDSNAGIWIGGGVYWTLGKHFNIGLEMKLSTADVDIFISDVDGGGTHFGALVGYHW